MPRWKLALLLFGIAARGAAADGGWQRGRSTYYGGPSKLGETYDAARGAGSFGILAYGSCGYTDQPGARLPFAEDGVAALADAAPDYPGSCGRCYEVRCASGLVMEKEGQPVTISSRGLYQDDRWRPDLSAINADVTDSRGRKFPGNQAAAQHNAYTQCWGDAPTVTVRIVDSCPCTQRLPWGEVRRQEWCCGGEPHFDLSYWAFEKLAHPVFGVMMIDFRPVDCGSQQGLKYVPGFVSRTIYGDGIQPGWGWHPYSAHAATLRESGGGPGGQAATCVNVAPGGGLSLKCREGYQPGYQPFSGISAVRFWIRSDSGSADPFKSSSPQGQVPPLKLFVMGDEQKKYCSAEPRLDATAPVAQQGQWFQFSVPLSAFGCTYTNPTQLDRLDFQNVQERDAQFCLADLALV